jgi:hypothetical protein
VIRRLFAIAAVLAVVAGSTLLVACCGSNCIKDPPCCQKPKEAK